MLPKLTTHQRMLYDLIKAHGPVVLQSRNCPLPGCYPVLMLEGTVWCNALAWQALINKKLITSLMHETTGQVWVVTA